MLKYSPLLLLAGFVALGTTLAGCSKEPAGDSSTVVEEVDVVEVPALSTTDTSDALASLSEADRAAVLAQKTCPVSDEPLGGMGTPIKVTVNGRDVFLCCEGCRDQLEADPDKFLAKLDAK